VADILEIADQFRDALLKKERVAAVLMIEVYGRIWSRLSQQIAKLNKQIADARARGEIVNQSWLFRQRRYGDLLRQVDEQMRRFAAIAEKTITREQAAAAKAGLSDSVALMEAAAETAGISASFNRLPAAAVENIAGFLGDGSPLKSLLDQLPREARKIVEDGLIQAVALGISPAATARKIREGLGVNLMRALTISRTETLRAYRAATIQTYRANADVVRGWTWRSARSRRSCAACIALDGTFHQVSEPMRPHVRCRCVLIPTLRNVERDRGADWFARQDAETQAAIIGTDAGYEAFKAGKLTLEDFVGLKHDAQWGDSYFQLSVKRALAGEGQFPE
jgi:SPP1 gp7 family putative phage head morphogenesis protein